MKYVVIDTETTGLIVPHMPAPKMIEFAGLGYDEKKLQIIINPHEKLKPYTTKLTGITQEMVDKGENLLKASRRITEFLKDYDVIVAHNALFDHEVLKLSGVELNHELFCTVQESMHIKGKRIKLGDLHMHYFNEKIVGAHRAMTDVVACERIFRRLIKC